MSLRWWILISYIFSKLFEGSGALLSLEKQQSPVVEKPRGGSQNEGFDLFGSSDDEDVEKERIKQERLRAYAEKKAKKPETVAKSSVILDVKVGFQGSFPVLRME